MKNLLPTYYIVNYFKNCSDGYVFPGFSCYRKIDGYITKSFLIDDKRYYFILPDNSPILQFKFYVPTLTTYMYRQDDDGSYRVRSYLDVDYAYYDGIIQFMDHIPVQTSDVPYLWIQSVEHGTITYRGN